MNENKLKILIFPAIMLSLLMCSSLVQASEVTGDLSTTVGTTVYGVVIAPPTASPIAGTYTSSRSVILSAPGALNIRYTTDGTTPSCSAGIVYSSSISVSSSQIIKAVSCYSGNKSSTVASYLYTINIPTGGGGGYTPPLTPPALTGDANKDGKVDIIDFNLLMVNWGNNPTNLAADLNGDGKVDIFDFNILMINWTI